MIEECMRNTYEVLTKKQHIEDILEDEPTSMFYGNPFDITIEDIDEMINFFVRFFACHLCSKSRNKRKFSNNEFFSFQ